MIDRDTQLKLQAHLDGELSASEARQVEDLLTRDAEAQALFAELQGVNGALAGFEAEVKLPESREFYWSKIQRQIQTPDRPPVAAPRPSFLEVWRRFVVPFGAAAALILAVLLALPHRSLMPQVELAVAGVNTFTYRDSSAKTTLVWFSYPAKNEVTEAMPDGSFE